MRIAFYAPLKPPDHPVPSGDRRMARLLMAALRAGGHGVDLASRLRSYDRTGDPRRQHRLRALGGRIAARLVRRYQARPAAERPDAWFTYHLYHKAPDWLGPAVADGLGIPYVVAEASHAPKRAGGAWDIGFTAAAQALGRADAVVGFNPRDAACVRPLLKAGARMVTLRPFLDLAAVAAAPTTERAVLSKIHGIPAEAPWLLAVAMMRRDKMPSYRVLGAALAAVMDRPWLLVVAGDGAARMEASLALAPLGGRVHWLGEVPPPELADLYRAADLLVWPAVNEAYGMALLEAQAAGLAAVAGDAGGVGTILRDGVTGLLAPEGDATAFAAAVAALLDDAPRRRAMADAARRVVGVEHGIAGAAAALDGLLREVAE